MTLIVVVIVSTFLHYKNMNYISENWNIDFPSENKKNNEIEEEFNKYIKEAKVSQKQLPDFTQDYKYYKKSDVGRSLIVVAQDQLLYIVSYNL